MARAYAAQAPLADGQIWAPDRSFADMMIDACAVFPKGAHDDLVDSATMCITWCKAQGLLVRREDIQAQEERDSEYRSPLKPVYDI